MKKHDGFTLVEAVVVIAVVAILAAIIVPLVAKQMDDAKIGRAKNECIAIAAAIGQFYKDVGLWPAAKDNSGARGDNSLSRLVSGTAVADVSTGAGTDYGYTSTSNDNWYDVGGTVSAATIDVFDNHLNVNKPEGVAGASYPTSGEFYWKGPYMPPVGKDPWGHYYICNIKEAYTGSSKQCVVISAGPNGYFDTALTSNTLLSTQTPSGDDIWAVVHTR